MKHLTAVKHPPEHLRGDTSRGLEPPCGEPPPPGPGEPRSGSLHDFDDMLDAGAMGEGDACFHLMTQAGAYTRPLFRLNVSAFCGIGGSTSFRWCLGDV